MPVAQPPRSANTILAAIRRFRITASSAMGPTTTSCRASAKPRPSAVHFNKPHDQVILSAKASSLTYQCNVKNYIYQTNSTARLINPNKPDLDRLACCTPSFRHRHNPCHHSHAQDCCTFWSQFRHHNFSSTRRNQTIPRKQTIPRLLYCCYQCHLQRSKWEYNSPTKASQASSSQFYVQCLEPQKQTA